MSNKADIDSARDEVQLSLSLLVKALDTPFEGATEDEMDIVRSRRSNRFFEAAKRLHGLVSGVTFR